jgi:hypothetical protein
MRWAVKFSDTDSARIFDDAGDQAMNLMTYKARSLDEAQRNPGDPGFRCASSK